MRNRIPTQAERIEALKAERDNRQDALDRLIHKLVTRGWTDDDRQAAKEHVEWIDKNTKTINKFYAPAMII